MLNFIRRRITSQSSNSNKDVNESSGDPKHKAAVHNRKAISGRLYTEHLIM